MSLKDKLRDAVSIENRVWNIKEIEIPVSSSRAELQQEYSTIHPNLTIVTAFWNISSVLKLNIRNLTRIFSYIVNPLVVYSDSPPFVDAMREYRARFHNRTKIFLVDREAFWPFHLITQIRSVHPLPVFPPYHPNTLLPQYSATQHTKYAALAKAAKEGYFNTPFYAWIGTGSLHHVVNRDSVFVLNTPKDFVHSKIAFHEITDINSYSENMLKQSDLWIRSDVVLGVPDVVVGFEQMYHDAVLYYLDEKLMNTDQQVLRWLYSDEGRKTLHPNVDTQLYKSNRNKTFLDTKYLTSIK